MKDVRRPASAAKVQSWEPSPPARSSRRSKAIGERFSALKVRLGHDNRHVYHSIRKTVGTLLENAGVLENVAADILGHTKPRINYNIYSGGA